MINNFVQLWRKKAVETGICLHGLLGSLYGKMKVYVYFQENGAGKKRGVLDKSRNLKEKS